MSDSIPSIPTPSSSASTIAQCTQDAVFVKSEQLPDDTPIVKGEDFSDGVNLDAMVAKMLTTGFQATNVALAIEVINKMVSVYARYLSIAGICIGFLFLSAYLTPSPSCRSPGD